MDPNNIFMKFMREEIRKLNLELDKDDRKIGRLAAIEKATAEKRAKIQVNMDKAIDERCPEEKAADNRVCHRKGCRI